MQVLVTKPMPSTAKERFENHNVAGSFVQESKAPFLGDRCAIYCLILRPSEGTKYPLHLLWCAY